MENVIIIIILVAAAVAGIFYAVRHFAGKSGCCGSGDLKIKKKKLSHVAYKRTFKVTGMHCRHCKGRVEEVVNDIKGVAGRVNLKKGILTVSYETDVDDSEILTALTCAGYEAEKI